MVDQLLGPGRKLAVSVNLFGFHKRWQEQNRNS
jgi:hypothetical protein